MPIGFETFAANLAAVRARIAAACRAASRDPQTVALLPITKNQPAEVVSLVAQAGLTRVGENRVQEARAKREQGALSSLRWELVGHLQSNKAALAATLFDRVQSVDSVKLLDALDRAASAHDRVLPVLLQVNAGDDPAKHGCAIAEAPALVEAALARHHLRLEGLMTIAPLEGGSAAATRTFVALRECRDALAAQFGVPLAELSMGMTGDLEEAIRAGSTQIRIGTALFGPRA